MFERTYQLETPTAPPLTWEDYEQIVDMEWAALLRDESTGEKAVHCFLERHPCLISSGLGHFGRATAPWRMGLISQPPLPSYDRRIPDFLWLCWNSDTDQPVLVEIESPKKRWFTARGQPTAQLTQALDQIAEWKAWFGLSRNVESFRAFYGLDRLAYERRRFRPIYMLIYGRRAEANARPALTAKRAHLQADDVIAMTYDRLHPDRNSHQVVCLSAHSNNEFIAISVPPTLEWSPALAGDRAEMRDLPAAIEANVYLPPARKAFLIRRLPYWNEWAGRPGTPMVRSSDRE